MTVTEFVERLKSTPRDWRLQFGAIRRGPAIPGKLAGKQCPVMAVAGPEWDMNDSTIRAVENLGLSEEDWWNIIDASDNATGGNRNAKVGPLRIQLLEACGLKEE